jgi:hypothetical protein
MANNITVIKPDLALPNWNHTGRGVKCYADYLECRVFQFDNGRRILAFSRQDAEDENSSIEVDQLVQEIREAQEELL